MVIADSQTKVAQYGQWDGYPGGQGVTILGFLKTHNLSEFKAKLSRVKFIDDEKQKEIDAWFTSIGVTDDWMTMQQSVMYKERYPLLSRDNGGKIMEMIMNSTDEPIWLYDQTDFAADSLYCQWAYVIDLDKGTFEVYKGFNKTPLTEDDRFCFLENKRKEGYYPVRMIKCFSLDQLPAEDEFVKSTELVETEGE